MSQLRTIAVMVAFSAALSLPAFAQGLDLPLPLPNTPQPGVVGDTLDTARRKVEDAKRLPDRLLNRDVVGRPIDPKAYEFDKQGARVMQGEIVALSPSEASLKIARTLDFSVDRERTLSDLGLRVVVLTAPDGLSAADALDRLRVADPDGKYDLNHVFDPSGATSLAVAAESALPVTIRGDGKRVGLVDGGIDESHDAFDDADITDFNAVAKGASVPTQHGTAVASLLVGEDDAFTGALPGAHLFAADVFGGEARGGAADAVARGLNWLAEKEVAVITVSLAGPKDALIEAAVAALIDRGFVLVAAAGNDGPAAAPVYPGAYSGVIAVTSVDADRKLQLDAGRGPHIALAAMGVDIEAAALGGGYITVTGTSYAAPLVSAQFARELDAPDRAAAANAIAAIEARALDLGSPGRDDSFGYGYLESVTPTAALSR